MKRLWVASLVLSQAAMWGQTGGLTLGNGSTTPGGSVAVNLTYQSTGTTAPSGLEWTLSYPSSVVSNVTVTAGAVATAAGKAVTCNPATGSVTCIAYGLNSTALANGTVATVTLAVSTSATNQTAAINVVNTSGSDGTGTGMTIGGTAGTLAVTGGVSLPGVSALSCNPSAVPAPGTTTCTVTLSQAAGTAGAVVALTSGSPVTVPPSVTVPSGATTASFTATVASVTADQTATVTATLNGVTASAAVTAQAAVGLTLFSCTPTSIVQGGSTTCTVGLNKAPSGSPFSVAISSNNSALTPPASVPVAAGSFSVTFNLTASAIASNQTVTLTATAGGVSIPATVSVLTAAAPLMMTPSGGTFAGAVDVTLTSGTAGATIYYTLDGSTPTVNAIRYTAPVHLTASGWIRAIAVLTGTTPIATVENFFSISTLTAPTISPNGGTFTTCPDVTLAAAANAAIYYTLDGTQPTQTSALYSQPIHLTSSVLLSARAFAGGLASGTSQASFTVNCSGNGPLTPPVITPAGGTFSGYVDVTITGPAGATIYYTVDGSTPGTNTLQYSNPIHVIASEWVRAIAVKAGSPNSGVAEYFFNIQAGSGPPPAPTITPNGGTFSTCPDVTLSSVTGATIYYTLDGTTPTLASSIYSFPIHLTQNAVVVAMAVLNGQSSQAAEANFTVNCGGGAQVSPVGMTPAGGVFSGSVTVTLATATPGATIYYTTDGSTPGPTTNVYTAPVKLTQSSWIRAIATRPGYITSQLTELFFTIVSTPAPSAPMITPNGGTFSTCPDVTLTTTTTGASIYYTLDGTVPTQSSTAYLQPIHLTTSVVVSARAFSGGQASSTTTASFTVSCTQTGPPPPPSVSPAGGTFTGSVDVTLTGAAGTTIYYTLDGSTPNVNATKYTGPIHLTQSGWIRAVAVTSSSTVSPGAEFFFVIVAAPQPPAAPTITPNGGTFSSCPDVTLATVTAGAAIYYTLDGSAPSLGSAAYTGPIHLTASTTIRAASFLSASVFSSITQASFIVNCQPAQPPSAVVMSPNGGIFTGFVDVTLTSTPGAVMYYTLDGSTPTVSTRLYTGPIHLTQSGWIRAIAVLGGLSTGATERFFSIN